METVQSNTAQYRTHYPEYQPEGNAYETVYMRHAAEGHVAASGAARLAVHIAMRSETGVHERAAQSAAWLQEEMAGSEIFPDDGLLPFEREAQGIPQAELVAD
jgi:hypothetical protein